MASKKKKAAKASRAAAAKAAAEVVDKDPDKIRYQDAAKLLGCSAQHIWNQVSKGTLAGFQGSRGKRVSKHQVMTLKPKFDATKKRVFGAARGLEIGDGDDTAGTSMTPSVVSQAIAESDSMMGLLRAFKDAAKKLGASDDITITGLPAMGRVVIRPAIGEIAVQ